MKKQKILKAILVTSMGVIAAATASFGIAACKPKEDEQPTPEHEHTYSGWQKDGTGHYKICTGDDCTEAAGTKFESAAHNTSGDGGACSVCGYGGIYAELSAKTGKIIAEEFETAQEKLTAFSGTCGTQGLYYEGATEGHYVKVEGGKTQMVKPANGETSLLVDFGLTAGTVEGYLEATISGSTNNSWTFFRFVNTSGKEIFGLRSTKDGVVYRLDGGSDAKGLNTVAFAQTTYKIYFLFDGATKKLTLTVNGTQFVKDLELSVSELGGIKLVSGNSHAGVVSLDNLVIVNDIAFADLQAGMKAKLQALYEAYDVATNYTTNGAQVTAAKETGDTELTAAETKEALAAAYNKAVDAMKAVKSDLSIYQEGKVAELTAYAATKVESEYSADNWTKLQGEVTKGQEAIGKAADTAAVDEALAAAKAAVDAVPDNSAMAGLSSRDDCEVTVTKLDTENSKKVDFTTNVPTSDSKYKANDTVGFLTFTSVGSGTKFSKNGYLSAKGTVATFTTTAENSTISFVYTSVSSGRTFDIKLGNTVVFAGEEAHKWENKAKTFTLEAAGTYTITFDSNEHKIGTITLAEVKEETVTAKVNKVEATVPETAAAGVAVATLVSKISVQLDYNGEMINSEITAKDQFTVIVKNGDTAVTAETLEAGTYTVIVIFGSERAESAATQYNSHTYTVTVTAAE